MKTVVICASKKYKAEVREFCSKLKGLGITVYEPRINGSVPEEALMHSEEISNIIYKGYTLEHFDWIRKADVCFIYNKDGYVGISVAMEIGYATALGKPVYSLEQGTGDHCSSVLIDKVAGTPEELAVLLD